MGVSDDHFARDRGCTFERHFVILTESPGYRQKPPLIPWERRLAKTEIWEFQELTSGARFGNRDYERPFGYILVTLRGFY